MKDLPLNGVRVVELGDSASAPFAGQILAGLGAEVWKVERPVSGDSSRGWGPSTWRGSGAAYHALNRGKKSICLDIKKGEDIAVLKRLIIDHADVFLANLRPGSSAQYGLDMASLRASKPELIVAEIGAFGHTGPLRLEPGYDPLMQAFSGIMNVTGEEGQAPVRAGVSIVDFGSAMWSVIGILAALFQRERSGTGQGVSTSLLETAIAWMTVGIANHAANGDTGGRYGSGIAFIVPHRAYSASDGFLVISCANDRLFAKLCAALDRPEWAVDPKFATNQARLANRVDIDCLIAERVSQETRAFWKHRFESHGVASAFVQSTEELVAHEQTKALGILGKPSGDEIALVGLPLSFDGERPSPLHSAPAIGANNSDLQRLFERHT